MTLPGRLPSMAVLLALLAFVLLAHPYQGVYHDGILYFGQVLLNTTVPELRQDIFFQGGSQDRYSIYSPLMGWLYQHFGRQSAHVGALLTSWLLMLGAVYALLKRLGLPRQAQLWGLLAFAVLSPIYGGCWIIGYSETFVTARTFAEPLLVWSLVALLAGRWLPAAALQIGGALFHPLLALPVMAVAWSYLAWTDRRWLRLLAVVPALLLLAALEVAPWDGLLKTYPPYWGALVETSNFLVQPLLWPLRDHLNVWQDVAVLLVAARLRPKDSACQLLHAMALTTLALMGLAILGADILNAILLTQLQLWRVHWIAHLLAVALTPWVCLKLWQRGGLWPASVCALLLATLNAHLGTDHGMAVLTLWALTSLAAWRSRNVSPRVVGLVCASILVCALALSADQLAGQLRLMDWRFPNSGPMDRLAKVAAFPVVAGVMFASLRYLSKHGWPGAVAALSLSGLLLTLAASGWDQRTDLAREIDRPGTSSHPFSAHLPADASVYWPDELGPVWGLLERTSHYSQPQGAGLLFNRDTALLFGPRKEMYRRITEEREHCTAGSLLTFDARDRLNCLMPAPERLDALCADPDGPDFLVLPGRLSAQPLATWQLPQHRELQQTFFLYACSQLKPTQDA